VDATVAGTERAFGSDIILRGKPVDLPRFWLQASGQPVGSFRQPPAFPFAGGVAEERRIIELAVQQADAAIVPPTAVLGEILLPDELPGFQVPGPDLRVMVLGVVGIVVRVDPAHDLAAVAVDRRAAEREGLLASLCGVLSGPRGVDGNVSLHDRR